MLNAGCMFEGMEISDGETISPHNQPCKICTCSKGVITCEEPVCDCSTWKKSSGRDLCCPQCDPTESCLHQELKHLVFRSGEQWIYQCQTCECLVSVSEPPSFSVFVDAKLFAPPNDNKCDIVPPVLGRCSLCTIVVPQLIMCLCVLSFFLRSGRLL